MKAPPHGQPVAGFTMLELMVVASIIALLAALALPAYQHSLLRSQRAVARAALVDIAARLEVEALATRRYPTTFDFYLQGADDDPAASGAIEIAIDRHGRFTANGAADPDSRYAIRLTASERHYELRATAVHAQTRDRRCPVLLLASTGLRSAPPDHHPECWSR